LEDKGVLKEIMCPRHRGRDGIVKVSSVYRSGLIQDDLAEKGKGQFSSRELSERLAPPLKPHPPSMDLFIIFVVLSVASLSSVTASPLFLIFGPLAVWKGFRYSVRVNEFEKDDRLYDKAFRRWSRLFYCYKDDIVFDSETGQYSEPEGIKNLIGDISP
jgi:hypothetical protein